MDDATTHKTVTVQERLRRKEVGRTSFGGVQLVERPFWATGRKVTHAEARAAASRLINSHFNNPDSAHVSIPADPDRDDDLIVMAYIWQQENQSERASIGEILETILALAKAADEAAEWIKETRQGARDHVNHDVLSVGRRDARSISPSDRGLPEMRKLRAAVRKAAALTTGKAE